MKPTKVALFVGTRPELIKMAPIVKELNRRSIDLFFIHTGQHYDYNMSSIFFKELSLPKPDAFLDVGSANPCVQISRIVTRADRILRKSKPNFVLVQGDTNSTFGAALAASRNRINLGHVEAGCRSFDSRMPEEQNRVLVADMANVHFTPTLNCQQNLLREGIPEEHVLLTGHPLVDILASIRGSMKLDPVAGYGVTPQKYAYLTMHREENVDDPAHLKSMLQAIREVSRDTEIIFPIHPHTMKKIKTYRLHTLLEGIKVTQPVGYLENLKLIANAHYVLTDSGGIQQEAALLGTPCLTLRSVTEWVETVYSGVNFLLGPDPAKLPQVVKRISVQYDEIKRRMPAGTHIFGDPPVAKRIVEIIEERMT